MRCKVGSKHAGEYVFGPLQLARMPCVPGVCAESMAGLIWDTQTKNVVQKQTAHKLEDQKSFLYHDGMRRLVSRDDMFDSASSISGDSSRIRIDLSECLYFAVQVLVSDADTNLHLIREISKKPLLFFVEPRCQVGKNIILHDSIKAFEAYVMNLLSVAKSMQGRKLLFSETKCEKSAQPYLFPRPSLCPRNF